MEFVILTWACISAVVTSTTNNIVLVSRYRSNAWLCWGYASTYPYVKMFTGQVKGGSAAGGRNNDCGWKIIPNCKSSASVFWFFLCLFLASHRLLFRYCSRFDNSWWIFLLRIMQLFFQSIWSLSCMVSVGTGMAIWREKAVLQKLGDKSTEYE